MKVGGKAKPACIKKMPTTRLDVGTSVQGVVRCERRQELTWMHVWKKTRSSNWDRVLLRFYVWLEEIMKLDCKSGGLAGELMKNERSQV